MPITEKQLAANRANAAKSTGPRSSEGKARSALNSCAHGFTASTFAVVRLEDLQEIAHLKTDLTAVYQPVNSQELFALERMALTQQAMLRAARLESGLFTNCLDLALNDNGTAIATMSRELAGDGDIEITRAQNRNYALADGFDRMARKPANTWSLFLRYQAQAERQYRRAVEEFDRLKALRPELPNEPILEVQPEENEPAYVPPDEPISTPQPNPEPPGVGGQTIVLSGLPNSRSGADHRCVWSTRLPERRCAARRRKPIVCRGAVAVSDYLSEAHTHLDVFGANALFRHYPRIGYGRWANFWRRIGGEVLKI
jgi:hypothetical protein